MLLVCTKHDEYTCLSVSTYVSVLLIACSLYCSLDPTSDGRCQTVLETVSHIMMKRQTSERHVVTRHTSAGACLCFFVDTNDNILLHIKWSPLFVANLADKWIVVFASSPWDKDILVCVHAPIFLARNPGNVRTFCFHFRHECRLMRCPLRLHLWYGVSRILERWRCFGNKWCPNFWLQYALWIFG